MYSKINFVRGWLFIYLFLFSNHAKQKKNKKRIYGFQFLTIFRPVIDWVRSFFISAILAEVPTEPMISSLRYNNGLPQREPC